MLKISDWMVHADPQTPFWDKLQLPEAIQRA